MLSPLPMLLAALAASAPQPEAAPTSTAAEAVALFGEACLQHYADAGDFARWTSDQTGFTSLPAERVASLTGGRGGRAFAVQVESRRYLLVGERINLCSVYAPRADPESAHRAVAELRAGLTESGQLHETRRREQRDTPDGALDTEHYVYTRADGARVLNMTVSTTGSNQGLFQFAISASLRNRRPAQDPAPAASAAQVQRQGQ